MAGIDNDRVAERLKRLREAWQIATQTQMAAELGVDFDRYNTGERGNGLSKEVAIMICQKFSGVTLDWLYFGKPDGLPLDVAKRLGEAPGGAVAPSITVRAGRSARK